MDRPDFATLIDEETPATQKLMSRILSNAVFRLSSQILFGVLATWAAIPHAAFAEAAFGIRPSFNNVPDTSDPGSNDNDVVVYNLPDPSANPSRYAGAADSFFDVHAIVDGTGTVMARFFGMTMSVSGSGEVVFNPDPIDPGPDPPNNVTLSMNPAFPQKMGVTDALLAETDPPDFPLGDRSLGIVGLHDTLGVNVPISDNEGLAAIPIRIAGGVTGTFELIVDSDAKFTGFFDAAGIALTDPDVLPHANAMIEVRESVPGDMNGDGATDERDISRFVESMHETARFMEEFPWLQTLYIADFSDDGIIGPEDIPGFEAACACAIPRPVGDLNMDLLVNEADLAMQLSRWGQEGTLQQGNLDQLGTINDADLNLLLSNWTGLATATDSLASVPEPSSLALLTLGAIVLLFRRHRRESIMD